MIEIGKEARLLTRYGLVGVVNNLVLYAVFVTLIWLGTPAVLSAGFCYIAGVALSYWLNRRWAFKSTAKHSRELTKFIISYGVGLLATLVILQVLLVWFPPEIAQIFNVACTAAVIYITLRVLRFGTDTNAS